MQIGVVGLERMGADMVQQLICHGHECVIFNSSPEKSTLLKSAGAIVVSSLGDLVRLLTKPRIVWLMLPVGEETEQMIATLSQSLGLGDIVIDGSNSFYKDDVRRARLLNARGMHYVDVGMSGGVVNQRGYCLMVGGAIETVGYLEPILNALAVDSQTPVSATESVLSDNQTPRPYLHCGSTGAGHFVQMVHHEVQCALTQVYAEGISILHHASAETLPGEHRYILDVAAIVQFWCNKEAFPSKLLDQCALALIEDASLANCSDSAGTGILPGGGVQAAIEARLPTEALSASLNAHLRPSQELTFTEKLRQIMHMQCHV